MYFKNKNKVVKMVKCLRQEKSIVRNANKRQRGNVLVFVTLALAALFGFGALAVDIGYLTVVRNELQNAADASALSIASYFNPGAGVGHEWDNAMLHETAAYTMNKVANTAIISGQVDYGYWDITGSSPPSWRSNPHTPIANELPAVMVNISKTSSGLNGGVDTFFARALGINSLNASATAVAVIPFPGYTKASLMPIAIPSCIYSSTYWDITTGTPTTHTVFSLGSTIHYSGCGGIIEAEWTSLNTGANSTTAIRNLIDYATGKVINPNQPQLSIGDSVHIESGVHSTLYSTPIQTSINGCSKAGDGTCEYAVIPVVNQICTNCNTPIQGFACVHILSATGKGTIDIELVAMGSQPQCKMPDSGGIGPNNGAILPPKLANYSGNPY